MCSDKLSLKSSLMTAGDRLSFPNRMEDGLNNGRLNYDNLNSGISNEG